MVTATTELPASSRTLVLPRRLQPAGCVNPWPEESVFLHYERASHWIPREEAERSRTWVQPIATVVLDDGNGRYCVAQRHTNAGPRLGGRFSIAFGGHIDESTEGHAPLQELLLETARRELHEETGVVACGALEPLALIRDTSSLSASRHIGFAYRATVDPRDVRIRAPEEFEPADRGQAPFMSPNEIRELPGQLDPWSRLLLERIATGR